MGWASGSRLFSDIQVALVDAVPDVAARVDIYAAIIPAFENFDCDTLDECLGFDEAFDAMWYVEHYVEEMLRLVPGMDEESAIQCAEASWNASPNRDWVEDAYNEYEAMKDNL